MMNQKVSVSVDQNWTKILVQFFLPESHPFECYQLVWYYTDVKSKVRENFLCLLQGRIRHNNSSGSG